MKHKLYKLYLNHEHLLLLDWLLNHVPTLTNMTKSIELAKQLKEVTSQSLRKIPRIYEVEIEES